MTQPFDPREFQDQGSSAVQAFNPNEFTEGFKDEEEEKPKKTLKKGSFMDQVHDVTSGVTAVGDLVTMLPGMFGRARDMPTAK